jgi:hypothetical protein
MIPSARHPDYLHGQAALTQSGSRPQPGAMVLIRLVDKFRDLRSGSLAIPVARD